MSNENSERFLWFLAGAAIGATVALLYAPASGRETREYIRKKSEEGRAALADMSEDILEKGREVYERGRKVADEAADLVERGRRLVHG